MFMLSPLIHHDDDDTHFQQSRLRIEGLTYTWMSISRLSLEGRTGMIDVSAISSLTRGLIECDLCDLPQCRNRNCTANETLCIETNWINAREVRHYQ